MGTAGLAVEFCLTCGLNAVTKLAAGAMPKAPVIEVRSGSCTTDGNGCAKSPNYPSGYNKNQACLLHSDGITIGSVVFVTEKGYDKLTLSGQQYSGTTGPAVGEFVEGSINWTSDYSVQASGWKICP